MAGGEVKGEGETAEVPDELMVIGLLGDRRFPTELTPELLEGGSLVERCETDLMPSQREPQVLHPAGHDRGGARKLLEEEARRDLGKGRIDVFDVQ